MAESKDIIAKRKQDHIDLALQSQQVLDQIDDRFLYEPLLGGLQENCDWDISFGQKKMRLPIWVSSMTGGTKWAKTINQNLARLCHDLSMGMGLGSCRAVLDHPDLAMDFDVRAIIGEQPLFGNLGIAQVQELIAAKDTDRLRWLVDTLRLDGLIIHVNPLQEWMQPEGDRFETPPIESIETLLDVIDFPIIVKEVGQGMGPKSLERLIQLPILAIEFAASGGTNFALLELLRQQNGTAKEYAPLTNIGHTAEQMIGFCNAILAAKQIENPPLFIVSGGIKSFLDGYYYIHKLRAPAIYGQASAFLKHARGPYDTLLAFGQAQAKGLALCQALLSVRT